VAALLGVLLVAARGQTQCTGDSCRVADAPPAAVVRIVHVRSPMRCYGSGTVVSTEGLEPEGDASPREAGPLVTKQPGQVVLTCAHLFRQGVGRVSVAFADGRQYESTLLAADATWDLAALQIATTAVRPAAIAQDYPRPGELLQSCGYGPDGRYWCNHGQALGYARTAAAATCETLKL
jgi:S1-C subfamily serine protease